MTEQLETLLRMLCKGVNKTQQNAQQTLYVLTDAKDAKLAYDVVVACGVDAKYFPETNESGAKLYVQNASLSAHAEQLESALISAPLFRQIKALVDGHDELENYTLSFANTPSGRQLTLVFPAEKTASVTITKSPQVAASAAPGQKTRIAFKTVEDSVLGGPAVARKAIPKSFKTSETDEDPLSKRIWFYLSGKAFTSTAWLAFLALALALIFSIIITIRGFLCPDIAGTLAVPSYCPKPAPAQQQQ